MSATAASVEAQAKVNLLLRVLAREEGGYHQIETLFARIELADSVRVATDTTLREVRCRGLDAGPMEANLAYRAATAFMEAAKWPRGFDIEIEKRIPVGGGLGGGSADAGAVLRALNALAPEPLSPEALATVGFRIGADIPYLSTDAPLALAWGRGERLLALRSLPAREVMLLVPSFGIATADAYGWLAESRRGAEPSAPKALGIDDLDRWDAIARLAANDLEVPVAARHPEIKRCHEALSAAGAKLALMSGSGSTVFGVFDRRPPAEMAGLPEGTRLVGTRTCTSVAAVKKLD
ncbi:MAG TPA: 4-(cytidine 5'-diphospho)-2-C-methyl-D-erythritol kinase [Gemmatimonadaceae bacterium]|nr:4-(cytidine 5'-diphospho)-2-C-methyl-D-erythritol kinase [Gemmatimonadaceae bacterium]